MTKERDVIGNVAKAEEHKRWMDAILSSCSSSCCVIEREQEREPVMEMTGALL
jgi:hypothetical protein